MIKKGIGFYSFKIFSLYPNLVNIITTKQSGNFLPLKNHDLRPLQILQRFGVDHSKVVMAQQVHSANVAWARDVHKGQVIDGVDGMFTDEKNLYLVTLVADCVPLLFYDPIKKYIASAHSGWQGSLQKICLRVVDEFTKRGSNRDNILIAFGPAICAQHYDVPESRARLFDTAFGENQVTFRREGKTYLDLIKAVKNPLTTYGIPEKNIEISGICTYENTGEFYSYRGENGLKGEFTAIIGLKG